MRATAADELSSAIHYRTVAVDGLDIFNRDSGPDDAPTILLLHGFPASSHMFRDLISLLADRYHLVAPDYPGFGNNSAPSVRDFDYTFDHLADVLENFVDSIGLERYSLYVQDFGGPLGFRLAARRPDRVHTLIVRNANAYAQGLSEELRAVLIRLHTVLVAELGKT
jgi:pimeloyl-ACP methyl ester carboxylesterase